MNFIFSKHHHNRILFFFSERILMYILYLFSNFFSMNKLISVFCQKIAQNYVKFFLSQFLLQKNIFNKI